MNQTIYFRKDIWERFKDEPNKSQIISQLLADYYDMVAAPLSIDYKPAGMSSKTAKQLVVQSDSQYLKSISVAESTHSPAQTTPVNKVATSDGSPAKPSPVETPRPIPKEMQPKFCKEGHPIPYGRDKCLGKGCKYS